MQEHLPQFQIILFLCTSCTTEITPFKTIPPKIRPNWYVASDIYRVWHAPHMYAITKSQDLQNMLGITLSLCFLEIPGRN